MIASRAGMKILVARAIEIIEAFSHVFYCMGVHNVQQNCKSEAMGAIHQILQILWRAEARADSNSVATAQVAQNLVEHSANTQAHIPPVVVGEGGIVTKTVLRKVLRKMSFRCAACPKGGGMCCSVELPDEAE